MSAIDTGMATVVLLSQSGVVREKMRTAIGNAGGKVILESTPSEATAEGVLLLSPAAVVFVLEDGEDDILDVLLPPLTDAGVLLLLEEAEVALQREGWDAQRWERHLAAKLQGHQNFLPPGAELEGSASLHGGNGATGHPDSENEVSVSIEMPFRFGASEFSADIGLVDDLAPLQVEGIASASSHELTSLPGVDLGDDSLDWEPPVLKDSAPVDGLDFISVIDEPDESVVETPTVTLAFDDALAQVEASLSLRSEARKELSATDKIKSGPPPLPPKFSNASPPSEWTLMSLDEPVAPVDVPAQTTSKTTASPTWNLDAFSLAPLDEDVADSKVESAGVTPFPQGQALPRGVAVLMGGIGGPDAVRRLLSALPSTGMAGAVLVHLRLDGGRQANLVNQLMRACSAPLHLAQHGDVLEAGHVYVIDENTGVRISPNDWRFAPLTEGVSFLHTLPVDNSAIVMLSGADVAIVPAALALHEKGVWVAGQSGEGCYDPAAASALAVSGLPIGEPAWLASGLLALWQ